MVKAGLELNPHFLGGFGALVPRAAPRACGVWLNLQEHLGAEVPWAEHLHPPVWAGSSSATPPWPRR